MCSQFSYTFSNALTDAVVSSYIVSKLISADHSIFEARIYGICTCRRGSRNFWWGDDMDEEKIGRGLGAAVGLKVTLFSRIIQ
jgi:phage gp46-like protein